MASVLTDQFIPAGLIVPLAPVTTAATAPQFIAKNQRTGNASVQIPTNSGAKLLNGTVLVPYRRYAATVNFNVKTLTTVNVTVNLSLVDSAATTTVLATTGAKAVNNTTSAGYLRVEFLYDPSASALAGAISGYVGTSLVTGGPLTNTTQPVLNNSVPAQVVPTVLLSAADAGSVFTVNEITLELL
jgi:hypothetical protein